MNPFFDGQQCTTTTRARCGSSATGCAAADRTRAAARTARRTCAPIAARGRCRCRRQPARAAGNGDPGTRSIRRANSPGRHGRAESRRRKAPYLGGPVVRRVGRVPQARGRTCTTTSCRRGRTRRASRAIASSARRASSRPTRACNPFACTIREPRPELRFGGRVGRRRDPARRDISARSSTARRRENGVPMEDGRSLFCDVRAHGPGLGHRRVQRDRPQAPKVADV